VLRNGKPEDICLQVRTCPLPLEGQRMILLFLQDITVEEWRAALERVFFHDINTTLQSLVGMSFLMEYMEDRELREMARPLQLMTWRIAREVRIQNALSGKNLRGYRLELQDITVLQIIEEMRSFFASHPLAAQKRLSAPKTVPFILIRTDPSLLSRVLITLLKNAFEATDHDGEVRFWVEEEDDNILFCVWNRQPVSEAAALRIFQRHFSTKSGPGRGFGTYSVKLFGEGILKGKVDFSSSSQAGTVFRLKLPREICV
jgi:signal transduction histidine kinase